MLVRRTHAVYRGRSAWSAGGGSSTAHEHHGEQTWDNQTCESESDPVVGLETASLASDGCEPWDGEGAASPHASAPASPPASGPRHVAHIASPAKNPIVQPAAEQGPADTLGEAGTTHSHGSVPSAAGAGGGGQLQAAEQGGGPAYLLGAHGAGAEHAPAVSAAAAAVAATPMGAPPSCSFPAARAGSGSSSAGTLPLYPPHSQDTPVGAMLQSRSPPKLALSGRRQRRRHRPLGAAFRQAPSTTCTLLFIAALASSAYLADALGQPLEAAAAAPPPVNGAGAGGAAAAADTAEMDCDPQAPAAWPPASAEGLDASGARGSLLLLLLAALLGLFVASGVRH